MGSKKNLRIIQFVFAILIVFAVVRLVVILGKRKTSQAEAGPVAGDRRTTAAPPLDREAYVVPKKLYISSLKSAQELTKQPVWVKEGYRYTVYPFANRSADFQHPAGMLLPIEKIQIKDVVSLPSPKTRQVVAVFDQDGKTWAVPIGLQEGSDITIYADEMFYYEDPHELFNFWPKETWDAIERHEVVKGMNEYQVTFAVGMGVPQPGDQLNKTVQYPNGGKPVWVQYERGKAVRISFAPAGK